MLTSQFWDCGNYEQTGELRYLDAAKAILLSGVEDKDFAKTVENLSLSRVIYDKEIPSDDASYESALREITKMWPPVGECLTKAGLVEIAPGLRHAHITLPRRIIRLFLNDVIPALESETLPLDDDTAAEVVQAVVKHINRGVGIGKPSADDEDDPPSELARTSTETTMSDIRHQTSRQRLGTDLTRRASLSLLVRSR
ncbi:hypothetical protein B0A54_04007 [Friedmanniomyces endolithicus]|uniref:Uncharacterized protein n=1 Tax=Friedmanniomyces endolithicus TaxID=329885 RepID=A0A4U0V9A8_9PEZI|nr:hypothetical protein B0A54_04007 [Friedmanniomyces endolithicus]